MRARILFVLSLTLAGVPSAFASDVGYLYGRVETVDGQTYQGELRWGEEESFWDDMFNADKAENDNLAYLDDRTLHRVRAHHWDGFDFFAFAEPDLKHLFAIRFGDLKRIEVRHGEDAIAEFRDGDEMALHGGSNDIGAVITVVDTKRGRQAVRWSQIRTITFEETPAKLDDKLGEPLYGTVHAGKYDFTGRIQWDNDEDLSIDKLDGESSEQKEHIAFGEIASIRKHRSGALVKLKSGDELYLTGTNDVNDENRGIVVNVARIGSIKVGWGDFDEVDFSPAPNTGRGYEEYGKGSNLTGTVVTRDGRYDGRIIFDLDESRDSELLQGMNGHTEYLIPFRDIARIRPEGPHRSVVELRMGLKVELEDGQDVSRKNDGVLVFDGGPKPRYVDWRDVKELVFR